MRHAGPGMILRAFQIENIGGMLGPAVSQSIEVILQ